MDLIYNSYQHIFSGSRPFEQIDPKCGRFDRIARYKPIGQLFIPQKIPFRRTSMNEYVYR